MPAQNTRTKLVVTKSTRVAEICDLVPGDTIVQDGSIALITDVGGSIKDGLLNYRIHGTKSDHKKIIFKYTFKLTKA